MSSVTSHPTSLLLNILNHLGIHGLRMDMLLNVVTCIVHLSSVYFTKNIMFLENIF